MISEEDALTILDRDLGISRIICGNCGSLMKIKLWWPERVRGSLVMLPNPNSSHTCENCRHCWMPSSSAPGDLMNEVWVEDKGLGFWVFIHDKPGDVCLGCPKDGQGGI